MPARNSGLHLFIGEATQAYKCRGIGNDKLRITYSHKGDEHPDSRRRRMPQAIGHAVDNLLANPRDGENQEKNSREKYYCERCAPRNMHGETNGVGEIRVQRHAWGQRDGIVGVQPHDQSCDRGRQARCKHDAIGWHSRLCQNLRVDHDDVRHGYKSSDTAKQFLLYRGVVLGQMEIAIDQSFPALTVRKLFAAITLQSQILKWARNLQN
jgi:hypothetical protein